MFFKLSVSLHSTDTNSSNFWITSSLIWDTFTHLVFVYKWKNTTFFNKRRKQTSNRDFLKIKTLETIIFSYSFFPYRDNYFDQDSFRGKWVYLLVLFCVSLDRPTSFLMSYAEMPHAFTMKRIWVISHYD